MGPDQSLTAARLGGATPFPELVRTASQRPQAVGLGFGHRAMGVSLPRPGRIVTGDTPGKGKRPAYQMTGLSLERESAPGDQPGIAPTF
jgi:hypothetical protein